jgi:hypothetical protein
MLHFESIYYSLLDSNIRYCTLFIAFDTMRVTCHKKTNNILRNKNIIELFYSFDDNSLATRMK